MDFLKESVPGIEKDIDLDAWVDGTGIPADAMEPVSALYTKIVSLAKEFKLGRMPTEEETADWGGQEWELYLENLPKNSDPSQVFTYLFFSFPWPIVPFFIFPEGVGVECVFLS